MEQKRVVIFCILVGISLVTVPGIVSSNSSPSAEFSYSPSDPVPDEAVTFDGTSSSDPDGEIVDYRWEVDGSWAGDDPAIDYSFDTAGDYDVTLEVTDDNGSTTTVTKTVTVTNSKPQADFSSSPSDPVPDEEVTFDGRSSSDSDGEIVDYRWEVDGSWAGDDSTMDYSFDTAGDYDVSLEVFDNGEKSDEITNTVTVTNSKPQPEFSYSPSDPVPDEEVTFDGRSSSDPDGEIVEYRWEVDRNYAGDDPTMDYSFDTAGEYDVSLEVFDNGEKSNEITETVTVTNSKPQAEFSYSPRDPVPDEEITFDGDLSSDQDGEIVEYRWEVDGDYADDEQTLDQSFDTAGEYDVSLEVFDNGEKSDEITKTVTVTNSKPQAKFSYSPSDPVPDEEITFDGRSSSDADGEVVEYRWEVDGDYADDEPTLDQSFDTAGDYDVSLEVFDNGEKSDEITKTVTVTNSKPRADFSYSRDNLFPDRKITFDAGSSSDPDGEIVEYRWEIDGNYAGDERRIRSSFDVAGTYVVRLEVTDNGERTDTVRNRVTVENPAPVANYSIESRDGLSMTVDASESADPDGTIEEFEWYVNDRWEAEGPVTTIEFPRKGSYQVKLVVHDNGEKQTSKTKTFGVSKLPVGSIGLESSPVAAGQPTTFAATNATDPDGSIESYRWEFSDGSMKQGESVSQIFAEPGEYSVDLTMTDDTGRTNTVTRAFSVKVPPEADFSWTPESPEDNAEINFTAVSPDDISKFEWDFGATGSIDAEGRTVTRAFLKGGDKRVVLSASGANGVTKRVAHTVSVREVPPDVSVSWQPDVPRGQQDVVFNATSPDDIESYEWDFDNDGTVDASGNKVTHAFAESGKAVVSLRAEDVTGDTVTRRKTVTVQESATFELTADQSSLETGDTAILQFSGDNKVRDETMEVKLQLNLPASGVSVGSVNGGQLVSRSSTNFVAIEPGGSETLRVRLQFNEPGTHSVGGTAVYYHGTNGSDRRESDIGPINVSVSDTNRETASASGPGFGLIHALVALALVLLGRRR